MLRSLLHALVLFLVLLFAVLGSRLISTAVEHFVEQVALSHIRHDTTGLAELSKSKRLSALTPEQIESVIEGKKLTDEARKYLGRVGLVAHFFLLVILTIVLIKLTRKREYE